MKTHLQTACFVVLFTVLAAGCASNRVNPSQTVASSQQVSSCIALQDLPDIRRLNGRSELQSLVKKYEGIQFFVVKDGEAVATSTEDYKKLTTMIREFSGYIKLQDSTLKEVYKFYDESLDSEEMDKPAVSKP